MVLGIGNLPITKTDSTVQAQQTIQLSRVRCVVDPKQMLIYTLHKDMSLWLSQRVSPSVSISKQLQHHLQFKRHKAKLPLVRIKVAPRDTLQPQVAPKVALHLGMGPQLEGIPPLQQATLPQPLDPLDTLQ